MGPTVRGMLNAEPSRQLAVPAHQRFPSTGEAGMRLVSSVTTSALLHGRSRAMPYT